MVDKEKVKAWFEKNWVYVAYGVGGVATVVAVALGISSGLAQDKSVGDLLVIDKSKSDWMDQLTTPAIYKGKHMTVRQADSGFHLESYKNFRLREQGICTSEMDAKLISEFCQKFPYDSEVLETLEGLIDSAKTKQSA